MSASSCWQRITQPGLPPPLLLHVGHGPPILVAAQRGGFVPTLHVVTDLCLDDRIVEFECLTELGQVVLLCFEHDLADLAVRSSRAIPTGWPLVGLAGA